MTEILVGIDLSTAWLDVSGKDAHVAPFFSELIRETRTGRI
jgi:hypothetical protein